MAKYKAMTEISASRYPFAELTTVKLTRPTRSHPSTDAYSNEEVLLLTDIIEEIKRVKRERIHAERKEIREAAKSRRKARRDK